MFDEWADWCAEAYDSHASLPVPLWFREPTMTNIFEPDTHPDA